MSKTVKSIKAEILFQDGSKTVLMDGTEKVDEASFQIDIESEAQRTMDNFGVTQMIPTGHQDLVLKVAFNTVVETPKPQWHAPVGIAQAVATQLQRGHSVTVLGGERSELLSFRRLVHTFLAEQIPLGIRIETVGNTLVIAKVEARFEVLRRTGTSFLHTPVVVFLNVKDPTPEMAFVIKEAQHIAIPFPDGNPPLIINC